MTLKMVMAGSEILVKFDLIIGPQGVLPSKITYISDKARELFCFSEDADENIGILWDFLNKRVPEYLPGESQVAYDERMGELIGLNYKKSGFGRMNEDLRGIISLVNKFKSINDEITIYPEKDEAFFLTELDKRLNVMIIVRRE